MQFVIGSGPAGVSAAAALLAQGLDVTMLDAGGELEPAIQLTVARLSRQHPEAWSAIDRASLRGPLRYNGEGAPLKLAFGSDYVYRDVDALQPVDARGVDAYRALAAGGLSVLWGAAILPFADADFDGWPIGAADLAGDYVSALGMTGLSAVDDALARIYPLHTAPTARLQLSAQARFLLGRMTQHADALDRQHVHVGQARLAITRGSGPIETCVHCGMCLYGCPYGLIYSAQSTLQQLMTGTARFTYTPGIVVRRCRDISGGVEIEAIARETGAARMFEAERVYLAAGALPSTTIVLDSLDAVARPVPLKQSDHFLLPMMLTGTAGRPAREDLHTLCQLFVEVLDRSISRRGIHLQVYTYNDYYARMVRDRLGPLYPLVAPLVGRLIDRVVLVKGYLHSDDSDGITATLERRAGGPTLRLDAAALPRSTEVVAAIRSLLLRNMRRIGAVPIPFGLRKGLPGSGVHVGGSFPMRQEPSGLDSDVLGRPAGLTRVHVVDASVFPTLPAAPPTLTSMANASRIARCSQPGHEGTACSG